MLDRPLSRRGLLKLGAAGTASLATGAGSLLLGEPAAATPERQVLIFVIVNAVISLA